MKEIDLELEKYIGADIVRQLVNDNAKRYSNARVRFAKMDITKDDLPQVDLVLCRDLLVHLTETDIFKALAQLKKSGATYLLTTTFPNLGTNIDIKTGEWRAIDLCSAPFNFPEPLKIIDEQFALAKNVRKTLALWRIRDING